MYHALIVADIDHFKKFNDTYGHPVGDRVLGVVAAVMKSTLRKDVFLARTGGEEFAVILKEPASRSRSKLPSASAARSKRRRSRTRRPARTMARSRCRLGICMASDADSAEELYNKADVALYAAKHSGRNCFTALQAGTQPGIREELDALQKVMLSSSYCDRGLYLDQPGSRDFGAGPPHSPCMLDSEWRSSYRLQFEWSGPSVVSWRPGRIVPQQSTTALGSSFMTRLISFAFLALCLMVPATVQAQPAGQTHRESENLCCRSCSRHRKTTTSTVARISRRSSAR
jgi:diguanylate cyclase (GGDEF)-like protein